MRILLKGGVWKNTEDEILKAAVMKYGKNQWARISSLLVRKSPKQCKQRWYEWLDPSIRKTPWTREEEEKLLHLAKIMPTQWRTIAACLDGRTASQCLTHYERLLDKAQGKEIDPADDPRRLRPGEIDPNPEVKPALPDPVDMDEDEKEMLQEARARLANTKGKKAKRKARERTLDEAKRLAALQKRRELKQAGVHVPVPSMRGGKGKKKKRARMIDVMAEVPFHKTAPTGFYDTSRELDAEVALTKNPNFTAVTLRKLEGERKQEIEERAKREDANKLKKLKETNLPKAMAKLADANAIHDTTKRPALQLPSPQISNDELEGIAKMTKAGMSIEEAQSDAVTASLLPQLGATPAMITPMRTPLSRQGEGASVMRDASYLAAMERESQTPLLGGTSAVAGLTSDFAGAQPSAKPMVTPNVLQTPALTAGAARHNASIMTPATAAGGGGAAPAGATPARPDQGTLVAAPAAGGLFAALDALPQPQHQYQMVVPDEPLPAAKRAKASDVADAAELQRLSAAQRAEAQRQRAALLSAPLRRGLRVPDVPEAAATLHGVAAAELQAVVTHDCTHNGAPPPPPARTGKRAKRSRPVEPERPAQPLEGYSESELEAARRELARDVVPADAEAFAAAWETSARGQLVCRDGQLVTREALSAPQLADALRFNCEGVWAAARTRAEQCAQLEQKLSVYFKGYAARAKELQGATDAAFASLQQAHADRLCFSDMEAKESVAAAARLARAARDLEHVTEREEQLQTLYASLLARSQE